MSGRIWTWLETGLKAMCRCSSQRNQQHCRWQSQHNDVIWSNKKNISTGFDSGWENWHLKQLGSTLGLQGKSEGVAEGAQLRVSKYLLEPQVWHNLARKASSPPDPPRWLSSSKSDKIPWLFYNTRDSSLKTSLFPFSIYGWFHVKF